MSKLSISPIILILGAGSNVGQSVAHAFAAKGYKVALAARRANEANNTSTQFNIPVDLSDPSTVPDVFSKVRAALGIPSVVVYNAAGFTKSGTANPLSVSSAEFTRDLNINTNSAFVAAQQSVLGFNELPDSASKTFIYTGNILNTTTMAPLLTLGVGKTATAHVIESAASSYKDQGIKFYYGDERKADGSAILKVDGDAHAKLYLELSERKDQGPWQQTFVKGLGYQKF